MQQIFEGIWAFVRRIEKEDVNMHGFLRGFLCPRGRRRLSEGQEA